jgi:chaperone BCS1
MFPPGSFDPTSLVLLFIGKDHPWLPLVILITVVIQKWGQIKEMYNQTILFGKTQYTLTGQIFTNIDDMYTYGHLNSSVWAIIKYINKVTKENKELLSNAISFKLPSNEVFENDELVVIPASKSKIKLTPDIYCQIQINTQNRESTRPDKTCAIDVTNLSFTLSTSKQFNEITMFMNSILKEYTTMVDNKNKLQLRICKPSFQKGCRDMDGEDMRYPNFIEFKTNKTFDNLFFDGKDELLKRLDSFVKREKYNVLGLPETLGLLFYGEPGTGKTSCIKAIAKYLDKHLIIVPMNQIKTRKRLEELFFTTKYGFPSDKRIYVFEEIDCNGWENIVKDRRLIKDSEPEHKDNIVEQLSGTIVIETDKDKKDKDNDDKLTLGAILEVIDGLVECPGRVIIMTTNHKDHLDPALLRPGRIDMEIQFKRLRHSHIAEIFKKWYGCSINYEDIRKIPDYRYTQAEISQLLFKYENDSKGFIDEIIKL